MDKTYYQMLGVSQDADSTTIKNAFRKLAKSIIRTSIPVMQKLKKCSKMLTRPILY